MLQTYKAILRGNRLEWSGTPPADLSPERPVSVHITILEEPGHPLQSPNPGHEMAAILERLAQIHSFMDITDPATWEREIRQDRVLPDREE